MDNKIYRSSVDFRVLSDKLTFMFYLSDTQSQKAKWATMVYNTMYPVELVVTKTENGDDRMFLRFTPKGMTITIENKSPIRFNKSEIILEVFKNNMGVYGFNSVKGWKYGAFLSHSKYYRISTTQHGYDTIHGGALKELPTIQNHKKHAIQMVLPAIPSNKIKGGMSFDMDILIESGGQYITSLGLRFDVDDKVILEGYILDIKVPIHSTAPNQQVKLETTYIKLDSMSLNSKEIVYDYKNQLTPQNIQPETLELVKSNVYAIQNIFTINANLTDFNLGYDNIIEIPYNVSRDVTDYGIKESKPIIVNGKKIHVVDWVNEIRNNKVFSSTNKCMSLSFTNKEQLKAFEEKLKLQQIGNIETYPIVEGERTIKSVLRPYTNITQWIKRTSLNQFNDVRFTYTLEGDVDNILICPSKRSAVNTSREGRQTGLYTAGGEYMLDGADYEGNYHVGKNSTIYTGKNPKEVNIKELRKLFRYTPIDQNSSTDFCFTTNGVSPQGTYSGYTSASTDTYDLTFSGSCLSGSTTIPISDFNKGKNIPMIGDVTQEYKPYAFSEVYKKSLYINNVMDNYMGYSAQTDGTYRFTYKSYLNLSYVDTKWCDYLKTVYNSAMTKTYPSTDYEIKRLINTSIINAGVGETTTALMDTGYKYYPGDRGDNINGIKGFDFKVYLTKTNSSGLTTTLEEYRVLRNNTDGIADEYLTLEVNNMDKTGTAFNSCVLNSTSASTIFEKEILVEIDTGFINLEAKDVIRLVYDVSYETTSKQKGTAYVNLRLGHKLFNGTEIERPWFRAIKSSDNVVHKNLFFDQTVKSKGFIMKTNNGVKEVKMDGTLYITDNKCDTITPPVVNQNTFNKLQFIDSNGQNNRLTWDITKDIPTNNWQRLIEQNYIKDYTLTKESDNLMTNINVDGVFKFYLPYYNPDFGSQCEFSFPQLKQSYVVVNNFKTIYGKDLTHYIVITPECDLYRPCSPERPITSYDILHKTTPDKWKVVNIDRKININGKEIHIVGTSDGGEFELPKSLGCEYYCKCNQNIRQTDVIDSIFGVSHIMSDFKAGTCRECVTYAQEYCNRLGNGCKPVLLNECEDDVPALDMIAPIKPKGVLPVQVDDDGGTEPPEPSLDCYKEGMCKYTCAGEMGCVVSDFGTYLSKLECERACEYEEIVSGGDCDNPQKSWTAEKINACKKKKKRKKRFACISGKCRRKKRGEFSSREDCKKICEKRKPPKGCRPKCSREERCLNKICVPKIKKPVPNVWICHEGLCWDTPANTPGLGYMLYFTSLKACKETCETVITIDKDDKTINPKKYQKQIEQIKEEIPISETDVTTESTTTDTGEFCEDPNTYWCDVLSGCIHIDEPCGDKTDSSDTTDDDTYE